MMSNDKCHCGCAETELKISDKGECLNCCIHCGSIPHKGLGLKKDPTVSDFG